MNKNAVLMMDCHLYSMLNYELKGVTLKSGAVFAAASFILTQRDALHFFKQGGVALERGVSVKRDSV